MNSIRRFEPSDLTGVLSLFEAGFPGSRHGARHTAADFVRETLLGSPWADEELGGPLVATEGDAIVGLLLLHGRRMRIGDRTLRAICCSHLVVDPEHRHGAAGALLLGHCLKGPQDLTISDTASDVVARVWTTYGGILDSTRSLAWMQYLRPGRLGVRLVRQWAGGARPNLSDLPVPGVPLQLAGRLIPQLRPVPDPAVTREPLTAAGAIAELPAVTKGLTLRADYDEAYLSWLFARLQAIPGDVVLRMVRHGRRAVGWYAYTLRPNGTAQVLQVLAGPRHAEAVFADLLADAYGRGATLAIGRVEPHLHASLRRRRTSVGFGDRHVVHSRDPEVLAAYATPAAAVSRLDGEWW